MDQHLLELTYTFLSLIVTLGMIIGAGWKLKKSIDDSIDTKIDNLEGKMNIRFDTIDKRFDSIEERLSRIEQNHLDHITQMHAYPAAPYTQGQKSDQED